MNIVHVLPSAKRKTRALPVTGNYLIPEKDGSLRWAEPNDSWRLLSHTGQKRCLITNIRYDESEHSPDLWLYSIVKESEMDPSDNWPTASRKVKPEAETAMFKNSRITLDRGRKWYIRQFSDTPDKVGIRRFSGLPVNVWRTMWRRVVSVNDIELYGLSSNMVMMKYAGLQCQVYFKWPELENDFGSTTTVFNQEGQQWKVSQKIVPWLEKNCSGGFIPFSDYESMFPNTVDELTYTVDAFEVS